MTVTEDIATTTEHAEQLWTDLRDSLVNAERKIIEIIEARAWEPLGYDTFSAAWDARMSGFRLASDVLRSRVLYVMYEEGQGVNDALKTLGYGSGVGIATAENVRASFDRGIPADLAYTTVRRHFRNRPSVHYMVRVNVGEERVSKYAAIAEERGTTLAGEADKALAAWFGC